MVNGWQPEAAARWSRHWGPGRSSCCLRQAGQHQAVSDRKSVADLAQTVVQPARLHRADGDPVVGSYNEDNLLPLVGAERTFGDQQGVVGRGNGTRARAK